MPMYEFKCSKCDHTWEEMLPMGKREEPLKSKCAGCGKKGGITQVLGCNIGDPFIYSKNSGPSSSFKDVMSEMAKAHPRAKLDKFKK